MNEELLKFFKELSDHIKKLREGYENKYPDYSEEEDPAKRIFLKALMALDELEEGAVLKYLELFPEEETEDTITNLVEIFIKYTDYLIEELKKRNSNRKICLKEFKTN